MTKSPGSTAPGSATTTRSPTAKLRAPQTTPCGSTFPTSTWQYRIGFLKPVSSSISSTRPTTSGPVVCGGRTTSSTSNPRRTKAVSSSSTVMSAGRSTCSDSQLTGTFTVLPLPGDGWSLFDSERFRETDVALCDVVHVRHRGPELQRPLDAHAEGEAGVLVRVDAARPQHARVDHPAAAPLDPLRAVAVLREPDVELPRRLGEREVVRPPPGQRVRAEQLARQVVQRAAQVGHGQTAVDGQALDLVEHRQVRRVQLVGAVHPAGGDDVDRRLALQHGPG